MTADFEKCMEMIRAAKQSGPQLDRVIRALEKVYNLPPDENPHSNLNSLRLTEAYSLLLLTLDDLPPGDETNRALVIAAMKAVSQAKDSLCRTLRNVPADPEKE